MATTRSNGGDKYLLTRGTVASTRLNFQHFALNRRQGWLRHPDINAAVNDRKSLRIADLASGTGIWTFDIAKEYPNAEAIGLDISEKQYLDKAIWPSNVKLGQHDLFQPVPAKYENYFDLIHIWFLVAGTCHLDRDLLMQNFISMMRPGGVIQWEDLTSMTCSKVSKGRDARLDPPEAELIMKSLADFSVAVEWADRLSLTYECFGLEHAIGHVPPMIPSSLPLETQAMFWSIKEAIEVAIRAGVPGAKEGLTKALESAEADFAGGDLWGYVFKVAIAIKPL